MTEDEERAEQLLNSLNELCEEGGGSGKISAQTIAERARVNPEIAVHLLFEMSAAQMIEFNRSDDADPSTSFVQCHSD